MRLLGLSVAAAVALTIGALAGTRDAAAVPVNIIPNGSFEDISTFDGWTVVDQEGSAGTWCPQTGTDAPGITLSKSGFTCGGGSPATVPPPPEGSTAAMTDQANPSASALYQCVDIPSGVTSAQLTFQLYLLNLAEEWFTHPTLDPFLGMSPAAQDLGREFEVLGGKIPDFDPNQQFRADIITPAGIAADPFTVTVLENIYQTQPGDPTESGYDLITADLSAYIGQSVCVRFVIVVNQFILNAGVDDVQLIVDQAVEPPPTTEPLSPPPEADEGPIAAPDTGSSDGGAGTRAILWLALPALIVTATGAAAVGYARRR